MLRWPRACWTSRRLPVRSRSRVASVCLKVWAETSPSIPAALSHCFGLRWKWRTPRALPEALAKRAPDGSGSFSRHLRCLLSARTTFARTWRTSVEDRGPSGEPCLNSNASVTFKADGRLPTVYVHDEHQCVRTHSNAGSKKPVSHKKSSRRGLGLTPFPQATHEHHLGSAPGVSMPPCGKATLRGWGETIDPARRPVSPPTSSRPPLASRPSPEG